jgi:polyhydroxyalkanoate synthesis regulator phasin
MEISLTKVTTIQHRELDSWASYLNRAVDIVPELALLYKEFLRYGKAELKNYLGDTVNCDDMPTWILRREGPGSSAALRALICDRTEDTMQKYDRSITGLDYYDIAYANGELMLSYGILVTLAGYKADVGRFRWVGGRARPRSGTWDDIVEHMLIDLWGKKIYICKISDVTLVPDGRAATSEEEQIMAYALDQAMLPARDAEKKRKSSRISKGTSDLVPQKGLSNPWAKPLSNDLAALHTVVEDNGDFDSAAAETKNVKTDSETSSCTDPDLTSAVSEDSGGSSSSAGTRPRKKFRGKKGNTTQASKKNNKRKVQAASSGSDNKRKVQAASSGSDEEAFLNSATREAVLQALDDRFNFGGPSMKSWEQCYNMYVRDVIPGCSLHNFNETRKRYRNSYSLKKAPSVQQVLQGRCETLERQAKRYADDMEKRLKQQLAATQQQLNNNKKEMAQEMNVMNKKVESTQAEVAQLGAGLTSLGAQVKTLGSAMMDSFKNLSDKIDSMDSNAKNPRPPPSTPFKQYPSPVQYYYSPGTSSSGDSTTSSNFSPSVPLGTIYNFYH